MRDVDLPLFPAAERNKEPILGVLRTVLPAAGSVLEIASGAGQHVVHFARALPSLRWLPSEPDASAHAILGERVEQSGLDNVDEPLALDALDARWPVDGAAAMLCINMVHISPWAATEGLLTHAGRLLGAGAPLVLYGPYRRDGRHTAASNEVFDESLRARNPEWGVRDLERVVAAAESRGLALDEAIEMPANNLTVVLRRG